MSESEFQTSVPELHEGNIYKIMRKPIVSGRFLPRFSRHGIFTNIYLKHDSNLGKYTLPPAYLSNIFIHNLWLFEKHVYIYRENTYNLHISIIYLLKKLMGFRTSWQWDETSSARKTQPVPDGRPTYSPFSW